MSADQGSSWAMPRGTVPVAQQAPPTPAGPPNRRAILPYILVGLLVVAVIVSGIVFAPRISAALDPTPTTIITRPCSQPGDAVGRAPDSTTAPSFGPPLLLDADRTVSYVAVEDAGWNSIALAYVKDEQDAAGGVISAISLDTGKILWSWDVSQTVDDDGAPFPDATLISFGTAIDPSVTPTRPGVLFSGSDHSFFCPNGQGRVAVFVGKPLPSDAFVLGPTQSIVYVFDLQTGDVVSHTNAPFGVTASPVYVDGAITFISTWQSETVGSVSDEGGVLWTASTQQPDVFASCSVSVGANSHLALVVNNTWFLTPNGYLDIHTGKPAPFGKDAPTLCYFGIGDLLLKEDPVGTFTPWNPKTNRKVGKQTFSGGSLIDGDQSYLFLQDQVQPIVNAYSRDTAELQWGTTGAPIDTNSMTYVGRYYLALMRQGSVANGWIGIVTTSGEARVPPFCALSNDQCESLTGERMLVSLSPDRVLRGYDMSAEFLQVPLWTTTINQDSTLTIVAGRFVAISPDGVLAIGR